MGFIEWVLSHRPWGCVGRRVIVKVEERQEHPEDVVNISSLLAGPLGKTTRDLLLWENIDSAQSEINAVA